MPAKKRSPFKDNRELSMELNSRRESDIAHMWESFVDSMTHIIQELLEILSIFWIWLHSWRTLLFDSSEQQILIEWLKTKMPTVPSDFTESWKDGILLCVLLENLNPGCSPRPDLLDRDQGYRNVSRALDIIERFDISPGIKAEDIVSCAANSDKQLISLLFKLKKKTESFYSKGDNGKGNLHLKRLPPEVQACFAKGTGLALGFLRRPARFTIFCESICDLDIVIEIKGPGNTICCERITTRSPKRKKSHSEVPQNPKLFKTGRSISVTENLMGERTEKTYNREHIQLEYEIMEDRISVDYTPVQIGEYKITILWHGQHIPGSPYHVSVEGTFEKVKVNKMIHLRPSLRHRDNSKPMEDSDLQTSKIRKHSVRFKDSEMENKEWGKVTKRKVLRYIVKLNGKEVEVDVDRSEMLAPALLKLDYELENNPTCYRRNSWGFVGDLERKKSMVRQFCVDLEDKEMYGMQRRSSSFHLSYSNDLQQTSNEKDTANTKSSNLKTVSEGTDNGFRLGDHTENQNNGYYESFGSNVSEILSDEDSSILQGLSKKERKKELVGTSPFQTSISSEIEFKSSDDTSNVNSEDLQQELKNDLVLSAPGNFKSFNNSFPNMNINQEMIAKESNTLVSVSQGSNINEHSYNQSNSKKLSNLECDINKIHVNSKKSAMEKNNAFNKRRSYFKYSVQKRHSFKSHNFFSNRNGYPLKIKHRKGLFSKMAKRGNVQKFPFPCKEESHSANNVKTRKPQIQQQYRVTKKSVGQNKFKKCGENNNSQVSTLNFRNLPHDLGIKRYHTEALPLHIESCNLETALKSPYILQNMIKANKYEESSTLKNVSGAETSVFNDSNTKRTRRTHPIIYKPNYSSTPPFDSFDTIPSSLLNHGEQASLNDYNSSDLSSIKSYTDDSQRRNYLADKSSYSEDGYSRTYKDVSESNRFNAPAFTFQYFKNRGQSFSRLSLGQSVKDIVKDFENNSSYSENTDLTKGRNFYSESLNFPPLAANEDRVRVKTRIMQWETTTSLPSGRRKNSYKKFHDREKLSVLSDVHSKRAFWETAYTKNQKGCMRNNEQTFYYQSQKPHYISKSDTGVYPIAKRSLKHQTKETDEDNSKQYSEKNVEYCDQGNKASYLNRKAKKHRFKNQPFKKMTSIQLEDRSVSDPGPIKICNSESEVPSKFSLSHNDLLIADSLWSIGELSSSATYSYIDDKEEIGDGYIDDEIPDYAAMFWDDYISNAGLLFDSRRDYLTPNADEVKVYGGGVYYGHVSVKNHFQVLTKGAGKGHLSVSVQGSSLHDVTNVSVIYSRRDIYTVTYQVIEPGYYLISVRWSDVAVPGSPFVCKITY